MSNAAPPSPPRRMDVRALAVALLLLAPLFFPRLRPPEGRWWETGWDALHFPGFILIVWVLARVSGAWTRSETARIALASVLALLIAGASELAHDFLGRSSSWSDFRTDLLGIGCGAAGWFLVGKGGGAGKIAFSALFLGMMVWLLHPAWGGWLERRDMRTHFPDIGCFSERSSRHVWLPQNHTEAVRDFAAGTLTARLGPGHFGGLSCWPAEGDWSGRNALLLAIHNPGAPFALGIRIDDSSSSSADHDSRFNGELQVQPGENRFRLPLAEISAGPTERSLDLKDIRRLILFTIHETSGREFVVSEAILE